jgi:hypothetical protein
MGAVRRRWQKGKSGCSRHGIRELQPRPGSRAAPWLGRQDLVAPVPGDHRQPGRGCPEGEALRGTWFDRTQEYAARRRGEEFDRLRYATTETLHLSPLPCWKHFPAEICQRRALGLIDEIEEEATVQRSRMGSEPLGAAAIRGQHLHDRPKRPKRPKKSPAPLLHAVSSRVRYELWTAYAWFVAAFRDASEKLRAGDRNAAFPAGSFPPALPFVGG